MAHLSAANYLNGSLSQNVAKNPSALVGVFVSSVTGSGTIAIFDDSSTGTSVPLVASFIPNVSICWYPMPFQTRNGINISIGATVVYTVAWD